MAKRKKKTRTERAAHRASWRGQLTFSLVSFPVEAFNAHNKDTSDIHFHQLHANCHRRIRYQKVCPVHGEVSNDEIVSGYEYAKDKYIEISPEELDSLRTESDRALKIDAFLAPDEVDPLYFDGRMYYLTPTGPAAIEPYSVIVAAMEHTERCAIGRLILSGKEQIALLRSLDGVLHMAMLNYEAEILSPSKVVGAVKKPSNISRQVKLAQSLIQQWTEPKFDFSAYKDTHRDQVKKLIDAKKHGREIVPPAEEETPSVVNLMEALKKSVSATRKGRSRKKTA